MFNANKKMLNMAIYEILKERTDRDHPITQHQIGVILEQEYGMKCDRRSVKNNIVRAAFSQPGKNARSSTAMY